VPCYIAAAERAANALALDRAMALYGRVWDLARDALPLSTLLMICDLSRVVGWTTGEEVMRYTIARCEHEQQPRKLATALFHLGSEMFQKGRYAEGRDAFQRGLALVDEARDPVLAARLRGQLGLVLGFHLGDPEQGMAHAWQAVQLLDQAGNREELAYGLSRLAAIYLRAGRWHEQLECNRRHLAIAEELGSVLGQVIARINLGTNLHALGDLDEAIAHTRTAIELAERAHATVNQAVGHNNLAQMLLDRGDVGGAARELAEAHRLSRLCGGLHFDAEMAITGARIAARRGDLAAATTLAEEAVATAATTGSPADQGWARRVLATILSLRGRHGHALRELERAAAALETSDVGELARTRAERIRVLARGGWHDTARAEREQARAALAALAAHADLAHLDDLSWI
jgi:tetratricopeptide (TPR) repeat protein